MDDPAESVLAGGCGAWVLPPDATCSRAARAIVRTTLSALRAPEELTDDAVTIVSEFGGNVFEHALGGEAAMSAESVGLPELWLYPIPSRSELVMKVYDSAPWLAEGVLGRTPAGPYGEGGRGLELVSILTAGCGGRWGRHLTRSRLGASQVPGKAMCVVLPMPSWSGVGGGPGRISAKEAAAELQAQVAARGIGHLYRSDGWEMSVLSADRDLSVWARDGSYSWKTAEGSRAYSPYSDVVNVAEELVRIHEEGR